MVKVNNLLDSNSDDFDTVTNRDQVRREKLRFEYKSGRLFDGASTRCP